MSNGPIWNNFIYSCIYLSTVILTNLCVWSCFPPIWLKWRTFALIILSLIALIILCAYLLLNIMNILAILYSIQCAIVSWEPYVGGEGLCLSATPLSYCEPFIEMERLLVYGKFSGTLLACCLLKGALAAWLAWCRWQVWIASRILQAGFSNSERPFSYVGFHEMLSVWTINLPFVSPL